jgi:hypothetical protein
MVLASQLRFSFSAIMSGESHLVTKSTIPSVSFLYFGDNVRMLSDKGIGISWNKALPRTNQQIHRWFCLKTCRDNFPSLMGKNVKTQQCFKKTRPAKATSKEIDEVIFSWVLLV